jgi:hypothetical protein
VTWSLCAHELPAQGNHRSWPRHWLTGVSNICIGLVFSSQNRGWSLVRLSLVSFEFSHLRPFLLLAGFILGRLECTGAIDEVIPSVGCGRFCCASVCSRDAESLVLDGELVEAHWSQDVAGERAHRLLSSSAEGA